ncbi:MAG: tetratricopeptide repeat protein [Myxococcales bacterium]|nr:tetratricopeptide repeat protein [Myxococcales bacterium]
MRRRSRRDAHRVRGCVPRRLFAGLLCATLAGAFPVPAQLDLGLGPGVAYAQRKKEAKRKPPPTRKVQTVGKSERKLLMGAQEAMAEDDYERAEQQLRKLEASDKRNDYETALMQQLFGHVYAERNDYERALKAFEAAISTRALPLPAELNLRYNLGQLYLATERYEEAIRTLEAWLELAENPAPRAYLLLAHAYVSLGEYRKALVPAKTAVERSPEPKQQWLRLLLAIHLELDQLVEAAEVLQVLVAHFSSKTYWIQLSAIYGSLERDQASLTSMELAYRLGFLTESKELVRMAELYLYNAIPYQAGRVLEQGFSEKRIEKTEKNWQLLADSWITAKEFERALPPLERAATLSEEGDLSLRLGHVYLQSDDWANAARALRNAIGKGGLDKPSSAQLLLGISLFHLGKPEAAEKAFQQAARHEQTKRSAREWLTHLRRSL